MEKEIRNIYNNIKNSNSRVVEGLAISFNTESQSLGWIETILPGAIDEDTLKRSDIFCYLNHDENRGVLARSRYGVGSLELKITDEGLYYSFEAPETQLGNELLSYLKRGEITSSSFAFTIAEGGDKWYRDESGNLRREIRKIDKLFDVSPVFTPAYESTSCTLRKFEEINSITNMLDSLRGEFESL